MDKIKRFIDCYVPIESCNFKCHYCYISHLECFNGNTIRIDKTPSFIRKALSQERMGGVCMLNFCAGGETLLYPEIIPIIKELLEEGHYVMIVTNGSLTSRFEDIAKFEKKLLERLFFKFSFHYLELIRLKLLDNFVNNVKLMRKVGSSITIEITPNDEIIQYKNIIKDICLKEFGALPHVTVARQENNNIPLLTCLPKEDYIKEWSIFDSELFNFKMSIFGEKRKEFCYAGDWSFVLNIATGDIKQCYRGITYQNIYSNLKEPIKTFPVGNNCPEPHCFNGHAFLSFGNIPDLDTPNFEQFRNRKTSDGAWLTPCMENFMKTKLYETNKEYSKRKKKNANRRNQRYLFIRRLKQHLKRVISKK